MQDHAPPVVVQLNVFGARFYPFAASDCDVTEEKMKTRSLLAAMTLLVGLGLAGCATTENSLTEKGMKPLSEAELKTLYSGTRKFKWTNAQNRSGTGELRADGAASVEWGTGSAQGKYRIVGNTLCTQYDGVRGGAETCFRMYKTGDNEYRQYFTNGEYNAVVSFTN